MVRASPARCTTASRRRSSSVTIASPVLPSARCASSYALRICASLMLYWCRSRCFSSSRTW